VPAFSVIREASDTFPATLQQSVMTEFIREGHFARHLRRTRQTYRERHAALVAAIREMLPSRFEMAGSETGMHLTLLLPEGMDDVDLTRRAATAGISVRPLSICHLKPPERGGLILGYGGADIPQIRAGMRILKQLLT
jgi:GntR family transcriptional regulator / MocR family aminotransferase